jgi:hypothetical protein
MPLHHTNRQGETHYFRAVTAAKGGTRYYITKDPKAAGLIDDLPAGFEVYEQPHDARVVFRKRVPKLVTEAERAVVGDAVANLSAVNDFLVEAQGREITVYLSQFNSVSGDEHGEMLTAEEARRIYPEVDRWKQYDARLKFVLVGERPRQFAAYRMSFTSLFDHDFVELNRSPDLAALAEELCPHLGRPSFFDLVPPGWEEPEDDPAPLNLGDFFNQVLNQAVAHFEERKEQREKKARKSPK